jgi:hypothetical protein
MIRTFCFVLALLLAGCATPSTESFDGQANYRHVFKEMRSPMPKVVRSRLERTDRRLFGIKMSPANGEWEFEMVAASDWVEEVKTGFLPTSFEMVSKRNLPSWFSPNEEEFEVFRIQATSFAAAHLYVERSPKNADGVRVFIRRH